MRFTPRRAAMFGRLRRPRRVRRLVEIGREEKLDRTLPETLEGNIGMQRAALKNGFSLHHVPQLGQLDALLDLREPVATESH